VDSNQEVTVDIVVGKTYLLPEDPRMTAGSPRNLFARDYLVKCLSEGYQHPGEERYYEVTFLPDQGVSSGWSFYRRAQDLQEVA
jgi:hypothetical protein